MSALKRVVSEQAERFWSDLREDQDRLRRGVQDNWPGESHDNYEESVELEDFEFEAKKKEEEDKPDEDSGGEENKSELRKKSPPKETEKDSGEEEEETKKEPQPKHKKAKKGLEKAQKQKLLPKSQVDPKTGMKQDIDIDTLAQMATEMGYRLERNEPKPEENDFDLDDLDLSYDEENTDSLAMGDSDEMNLDMSDDEDMPQEEDVAIVSSDEDIKDVLDFDNEEDVEDEGMRLDIEGNPLSMKKAGTILKHGEVDGRPLTKKQKGLFGAIRGGTPLKKY